MNTINFAENTLQIAVQILGSYQRNAYLSVSIVLLKVSKFIFLSQRTRLFQGNLRWRLKQAGRVRVVDQNRKVNFFYKRKLKKSMEPRWLKPGKRIQLDLEIKIDVHPILDSYSEDQIGNVIVVRNRALNLFAYKTALLECDREAIMNITFYKFDQYAKLN